MTYINFSYNNEDTIYDEVDFNKFLENLIKYYETDDLVDIYSKIDEEFADKNTVNLLITGLNVTIEELILYLSKIYDKIPSRKLKNTLLRE